MLEPRSAIRPLVDLGAVGEHPHQSLDVRDHARAQLALGLAMAAVVEGERGEAVVDRRAREVGVVLLSRSGAVQDDHGRAPGPSPSGSHRWYAIPSRRPVCVGGWGGGIP